MYLSQLTFEDFPLMNVGALVYSRRYSSPLFTAPTTELAADLVMRLNRDHLANTSVPSAGGGETMLVYGKG